MNNIICYKIKCLTNLHVGDGEINYNIIDNEIEKDPVNQYPVIFSSGVKGAFREHLSNGADANQVNSIFGSEKNQGEKESKPGNLKFTNAYILGIPMRASEGSKSHYLVTSKNMLHQLLDLEEALRPSERISNLKNALDKTEIYTSTGETGIAVEGMEKITKMVNDETLISYIKSWLGEDVILLAEEDIRNYSYPVQARNKLDNGISNNLWYEEYLPHEAVFFTYVMATGTKESTDALTSFTKHIMDNPIVQFGANATIGFGLTKLTEMKGEKNE